MASIVTRIPQSSGTRRNLSVLGASDQHHFIKPLKRIHDGQDVDRFLVSRAYVDIGVFITQLNVAMCPRGSETADSQSIQTWDLDGTFLSISEPVKQIQDLLKVLDAIIDEAPPDTGPRRFGNVSFRKWHQLLEARVSDLLDRYLPGSVLMAPSEDVSSKDELSAYFLGGFGSSQRLDYGTGHELSFLAFLGCIWKLGGFTKNGEIPFDGSLERSIVLAILEPYLQVIRRLILTYTLEPAGSHGVWGLDDHFFLPYIFGSAQYSPAIKSNEPMPVEGSRPGAPKPGDVAKKSRVDVERQHNMYFSAVGFIMDVKNGPFWEHSPILFDISGVRSGWAKINKGMIKMYNAEVLSKFPVVQHFPFGSLFSWEQDPTAETHTISAQTSSQPSIHAASVPNATAGILKSRPPAKDESKASWACQLPNEAASTTTAPWASLAGNSKSQVGESLPSRAQPASGSLSSSEASIEVSTKAPWAREPTNPHLPRR